MSTEENYSNRSHVRPNDPDSVPPPVTGKLGLPPIASNIATVQPHPQAGTVKLDAQPSKEEEERDLDAKAEMYEHFKVIREHVCPLDSHCTKVNPKALLLGDDSNYSLSDVSFSEATGKQRLALGGEFTALQQQHLIEAHPDYVKKRTKEYLEGVYFRTNLINSFWDKYYNGEALKEHMNMDRDAYPKGAQAYDFERSKLAFAEGGASAKLKELISQKKNKPYLSKIYEQTTEELFKELDRRKRKQWREERKYGY